jgi:hypothetical protein
MILMIRDSNPFSIDEPEIHTVAIHGFRAKNG